jgi:Acetyl-CoA dehydrogenase C-terminal like
MVSTMVATLASTTDDARNIYKVGQNTTRLLLAAGDLLVGYLLLRQAVVALARLDDAALSASERAFYEGKPAVAHFFASTVLPELTARRAVAESVDNALMDVAEESF